MNLYTAVATGQEIFLVYLLNYCYLQPKVQVCMIFFFAFNLYVLLLLRECILTKWDKKIIMSLLINNEIRKLKLCEFRFIIAKHYTRITHNFNWMFETKKEGEISY